MDKTSESYRRAAELDRQGFAQHLKQISQDYFQVVDEDEMGIMAVGVIANKANKVFSEKYTFEYDEANEDQAEARDPVVESPDPELSEETIDPLLAKEREQVHVALAKLRTVYSPRKTPNFSLPVHPEDRIRFREFINWVNQTSGKRYTLTENNDAIVTVTKLPDVDLRAEAISVSAGTEFSTYDTESQSECSIPV